MLDTKAVSTAPGSAGALTEPQYGTGSAVKHTHAKAGGGAHTHEHPDARPGHQHAADDKYNASDVALLPVPRGALGKGALGDVPVEGFRLDFEVKAAAPDPAAGYPTGTLILTGYANTWVVDRDKERFAKTAFDRAIDDYLLNPILLDNHDDSRPIGYMEAAQTDDMGLRVKGVVPPPPQGSEPWHIKAYHDIKSGLRRTLSVGGIFIRSKSIAGLIESVKWYETSLVSIPANPYSVFAVAEAKGLHFAEDFEVKRNWTAAEREQAVKDGHAMAGGVFPIETRGDVHSAVVLWQSGHHQTAAAKEHIIEQAKRLGATSLLPDDWNVSGKAAGGNAGNPAALIKYFNNGAGGKIKWGSAGDFDQCVAAASDYMDDAAGFCELRHKDATGMSTSQHAAQVRKEGGKDADETYVEGKAVVAMPGVGRGHGRHRSGGRGRHRRHRNGTHTHRKAGIRHRHLGGSRSHTHRGLVKGLIDWDVKAPAEDANVADDGENDGVDALDAGDVPALIAGLAAALSAVVESDQSAEDKIANVDSLLDEFADAIADALGSEAELPEEEDNQKWLSALLESVDPSPSGRQIKTALARLRGAQGGTNVDELDEKPGKGTKGATLEVPEADFKAMTATLEALKAEKDARDEDAKAAKLAEEQLKAEREAEEKAAKEQAEADERVKELVAKHVSALRGTKKFRHPSGPLPGSGEGKSGSFVDWLLDVKSARRGDHIAYDRIVEQSAEAAEAYGIKALVGSTSTAGGFLVPPQYWQQGLAEFRIAAAKVRPLCTVIPNINSNLVYIPRETGIAAVGWTAENATKPSQDQNFGQIAVNLFTLAGISKVSNQLLDDSSPAVDTIVRKDLGRMIGQAEDIAFIDGTGVGQPTGILRTNGVLTVAYSAPAAGSGIADALSGSITAIQSNYFGDPTAIVAHPRNVGKLRQVKDSNGRYILEAGFDAQNSPFQGGAGSLLAGQAQTPQAVGSIWGLPVISDANVPTNYSGTTPGAGTESPIIVADFSEAYVLERSGFAIDVSSEAGTAFEQNQTWFRGEERLGFTAARQPTAFCFITGLGPAIAG